jgi:hypothetical protein
MKLLDAAFFRGPERLCRFCAIQLCKVVICDALTEWMAWISSSIFSCPDDAEGTATSDDFLTISRVRKNPVSNHY